MGCCERQTWVAVHMCQDCACEETWLQVSMHTRNKEAGIGAHVRFGENEDGWLCMREMAAIGHGCTWDMMMGMYAHTEGRGGRLCIGRGWRQMAIHMR